MKWTQWSLGLSTEHLIVNYLSHHRMSRCLICRQLSNYSSFILYLFIFAEARSTDWSKSDHQFLTMEECHVMELRCLWYMVLTHSCGVKRQRKSSNVLCGVGSRLWSNPSALILSALALASPFPISTLNPGNPKRMWKKSPPDPTLISTFAHDSARILKRASCFPASQVRRNSKSAVTWLYLRFWK